MPKEGVKQNFGAYLTGDRVAENANGVAASWLGSFRCFFLGVVEHICCRRDAEYHRFDPMIGLPKQPNYHAMVVRDLFRNVVVEMLEGLTLIAEGEGFLPPIDALT